MKKIILMACIVLQINTWALGGYGTLAGDEKKIADRIKEELMISEEDTYSIFDTYLRGYLNTKNWSYTTFNNNSTNSSKLGNSENKTIYINFVTNERFINISFIKFFKEKQIQIHAIETLPRSSQIVIDKYNALKSNKDYTIDIDETEFSIFLLKEYTKRIKTLVYSGNGGIQFLDFYVYTLKK